MPVQDRNTLLADDLWQQSIESLHTACVAGAAAAHPWVGRLDKERADADAARAMRRVLERLAVATRIVAGEGAKDGVEHLAVGEIVNGSIGDVGLEMAVDPIEGTTNMAHGLPWALSVAAATPTGGMFETGPSLYMDKFVVPPAAAARVDPEADTATRLVQLAAALGKSVAELRIFVLDKPRHKGLALEIVRAGARVAFHPAGDVVGTCAVAMTEHFDAVMGIGGTPEGMLSACAVHALGAGFFARLTPQRGEEASAMASAGLVANRWMDVRQMIRGERAVFCAAGITESLLAPGIRLEGDYLRVSTLTIECPTGKVSRGSVSVGPLLELNRQFVPLASSSSL